MTHNTPPVPYEYRDKGIAAHSIELCGATYLIIDETKPNRPPFYRIARASERECKGLYNEVIKNSSPTIDYSLRLDQEDKKANIVLSHLHAALAEQGVNAEFRPMNIDTEYSMVDQPPMILVRDITDLGQFAQTLQNTVNEWTYDDIELCVRMALSDIAEKISEKTNVTFEVKDRFVTKKAKEIRDYLTEHSNATHKELYNNVVRPMADNLMDRIFPGDGNKQLKKLFANAFADPLAIMCVSGSSNIELY